MEEENAGGGGGGTGEGGAGAGGAGGAGAGGAGGEGAGGAGGQGQSQYVPYARFEEVNTKYRDLETKYGSMQGMLDQMKSALSPEQKRGFKLDYQNPDGSIETWGRGLVKEEIDALRKEFAEKEQAASRANSTKWFREQEGYSPELEEKAAQFIKDNDLNVRDKNGNLPMSAEKAVKLAYRFVTMGDGSGYTRTVKEGLRKPGTGGKGKEGDARADLAALDPTDEKYEEKMKAIHAKITGG